MPLVYFKKVISCILVMRFHLINVAPLDSKGAQVLLLMVIIEWNVINEKD